MTWTALTWNVLFGGEDRFDRILALLARERPDVVVLQECLGWEDGDRLERVADALGVPRERAVLGFARPRGSGRRYHVALLSRFPLLATTTHADPAHVGHCILEAEVDAPGGPVVVLGTHFDAHGEDERLRDARTLCRLVRGERVLVAGDLNALSTRDPYPRDLADQLRAAGTTKYGDPPRFDTMPLLESHGLVDLLHHVPGPRGDGWWVSALRDRGGVHIEYRTDYVLASAPMARVCGDVRVVPCAGASDHEPVLATFG